MRVFLRNGISVDITVEEMREIGVDFASILETLIPSPQCQAAHSDTQAPAVAEPLPRGLQDEM